MRSGSRRKGQEGKSTPEQLEELRRLAALPDDQIDLSDLPELTPEQLARMERGHFYRPIKQQITALLDADVLAWLKAGGAATRHA